MAEERNNNTKRIEEDILLKKQLVWNHVDDTEKGFIFQFCEGYKDFLSVAKTERLATAYAIMLAEQRGFKPLEYYLRKGKVVPGDRIYVQKARKSIALYIIGSNSMEEGMTIVGAHIDAPRLDLKQTPLYEENDLAFFKTHYYGGIKKYQWLTIPLAIHGTILKTDGTSINISIGEKEDDPVFCITDLLPHLSQEQYKKKINEAIEGEGLNIIIGSIPFSDKEIKEPIKLAIMKYLYDTFGIKEIDFTSAELEVVPAGEARDIGFDRSMIGAYGQDDRVCAYSALEAILDIDEDYIPKKTLSVLLADKEEIGSYGNTGMTSRYFENQVAELLELKDDENPVLGLHRCLENSSFLSADVTAAFDPNYSGTHDLKNAPYIGRGVVLTKYTGARGKSGCNDANAEYLAKMRNCFDEADVVWQTGELGRVDLGGGGTIAWILAQYGMEVVDCGTPVLSMHAPFEITSKADVFMTYKAYYAFLLMA